MRCAGVGLLHRPRRVVTGLDRDRRNVLNSFDAGKTPAATALDGHCRRLDEGRMPGMALVWTQGRETGQPILLQCHLKARKRDNALPHGPSCGRESRHLPAGCASGRGPPRLVSRAGSGARTCSATALGAGPAAFHSTRAHARHAVRLDAEPSSGGADLPGRAARPRASRDAGHRPSPYRWVETCARQFGTAATGQ